MLVAHAKSQFSGPKIGVTASMATSLLGQKLMEKVYDRTPDDWRVTRQLPNGTGVRDFVSAEGAGNATRGDKHIVNY